MIAGHWEAVGDLLDLGAKPNDKTNGGSAAFERYVTHLTFEDVNHLRLLQPVSRYSASNVRRSIEILVKAGAFFRPDNRYEIRMLQRALLEYEPELVFEVLRVIKDGGAAIGSKIRALSATTPRRAHVAPTGRARTAELPFCREGL